MANDFYAPSGSPATGSQGSSATMRAEFSSIEDGFDKLPTLTGNAGKVAVVNSGGTALEAVSGTGTGVPVRATSPTLVTPTLGVASATSINGTTIPNSATLLVSGGALGTPSSGTVTNLTGTASININGTVGATTPTTGAFTTVAASGVFTGPDGSASAPTYSFSSSGNSDNGMYLSAANEVSLSTAGTKRVTVTSDGRLYGTALHNNAGDVTGTANQYIASGTYTPSKIQSGSLSSETIFVAQWIRVGNVVTVSGRLTLTASASGSAFIRLSLPIPSDFSTVQCSGAGTAGTSSVTSVTGVYHSVVVTAAVQVTVDAIDTNPFFVNYTYTYLIQ